MSFFKIQLVSTEDVLFVFGKSTLKHWATSGAVTRGAAAISTNPDFDSNSGHGDISVSRFAGGPTVPDPGNGRCKLGGG